MTTDFRALCAELAEKLDDLHCHYNVPNQSALINRARAALAEADEPAVQQGREPVAVTGQPSDEELLQMMPEQFRADLATVSRMAAHGAGTGVTPGVFRVSLNTGALDYARAVLARWGNLVPAPPADGEVAELVAWLQEEADDYECIGADNAAAKANHAAELLQRLALVPVPVSERLPRPEDFDSHGYCWVLYGGYSTWALEPPYGQDGAPTGYTHWLPAHALPLPEVNK